MSISTEWFINNIIKYSKILKKIDELQMEISNLHDELINLSIGMTKDEIEEAIKLYEQDDEIM